MSPEDRDYAIRTLFGEAATDPASQAAVMHVILNRAKQSNASIKDVVLAPSQFEPWAKRAKELQALDPKSPQYKSLGDVVDLALNSPDPTGGATLFYAPVTQAKLGRKAPAWAQGPGLDIGAHRFYGGAFPTPPKGTEPILAGLAEPPAATVPLPTILSALSRNSTPLVPTPDYSPAVGLFDNTKKTKNKAAAKQMEQLGLPEAHITAATGLKKVNGDWT